MKKLIIGIAISSIIAIALSTFLPDISWDNKLSTLYAVSGIMFSIGMSIIITSSFAKVRNTVIRERIHKSFCRVRNSYILYFLVVSLLFMFDNESLRTINLFWKFTFDYSIFVGCCITFSILFFIINFLDLQKINQQIDEALE